MSDELKPVRCGCGGDVAVLVGEDEFHRWGLGYRVKCWKCGIQTQQKRTKAEAIELWNLAMGGQNKKKDMTFHWIESFLGYRCSSCGHICNTTAMPNICPNCHARLEWN